MPYIKNKEFTREDIIFDYETVKNKLGKNRLGRKEYLLNGQYTRSNIAKIFGTWNDFKFAIGERPLVHKNVSKEAVIEKAFELYEIHGRLTAEIMRSEGYAQHVVDRIFGGFGKMMDEIGIPQEAIGRTKRLTDEEFLSDLKLIHEKYGFVNARLLQECSSIPLASYANRYGTLGEACLLAEVYHVGDKSPWTDKGEAMVAFHEVANIIGEPKFHTEMTFDWLRNDRTGFPLPVDAFFEKGKLIVEYNGPRHYNPEHWTNLLNDNLPEIKRRDHLREVLSKKNGYLFLTIPYYERMNIRKLIDALQKAVKFDLLGLKNLSIFEIAVQLIKERHGIHIDMNELEPDDPDVFEMIRKGDTQGIFQLELNVALIAA